MMMKVFIHEKEGWPVVKNRDWLYRMNNTGAKRVLL